MESHAAMINSVHDDIQSQLESLAQVLRVSEEKFRSVVENSGDGITLCDEDGKITEWNRGQEIITGLLRAEVIGQSLWDVQFQLMPAEQKDTAADENLKQQFLQILQTGQTPWPDQTHRQTIYTQDGQTRIISVITLPIPSGKGYVLTRITRDITEREQLEAALQQSRAEVEQRTSDMDTALTFVVDLQSSRDKLEQRVQARTAELHHANKILQLEIAEREQAQTALANQTERLTLTLRSIGDGVITTDLDQRIVLFNPVAEQLTGWSSTQAIGQPLTQVFRTVNIHTHQPQPIVIEQVLQLGKKAGLAPDTALYSKEEQFIALSASITPLRDNIGKITGAVLAFRDITLLRQAEQAMHEARAAEAANRAKSQFLAHMSHEIRTPIHGITGLTKLLGKTELNAEQQEYLSMIKSSASILLDTVNDILDFSKIEAGKVELEQVPFDLLELAERAMDQAAPQARKKGLEMVCHVASNAQTQFVGDPVRLRQVLVNLIGNAVKFTEHGEVVVTLHTETNPAASQMTIHGAVRDTGVGIAADKQQVIFEAFSQSDGSTTRRFGGTGLGLAISRKLVELMGGQLWIESELGKGSVLHFTVQLEPNVDSATSLLAPDPSWRELPVLVIDEHATNRAMLEDVLIAWGLNVTSVATALAGLQAIETARDAGEGFRLVLLAARMSKTDGFKAASWFRDDARVRDTIVMMLSSDDVHAELARCRELGLKAHILKPIKRVELFNIVQRILNPHAEESSADGVLLGMMPARASGIQPLSILFVEDNMVNQMIGKKFLAERDLDVQLASNGRQALEKLAARKFDLILMDIEMPEMDGLEATRALRALERETDQHTPIIAMTAYGTQENRAACLQAGMDGYLAKPFTPESLDEAIRPFLTGVSPLETPPAVAIAARVDRQVALQAVGGSEEFLGEVIQIFLDEDYKRHLRHIEAGLAQQNAHVVQKAAHGLKGALGSFGGLAAHEVAHQIQLAAEANELDKVPALLAELNVTVQEFAEYFGVSV